MRIRYALAVALLAGSAGLAAQAVLAQDEPARQQTEAATAARGLSMTEIIAALESQGYSDFREIERERDRYEVKARDPDDRLVEVYVSAETGEVVRSKRERR